VVFADSDFAGDFGGVELSAVEVPDVEPSEPEPSEGVDFEPESFDDLFFAEDDAEADLASDFASARLSFR